MCRRLLQATAAVALLLVAALWASAARADEPEVLWHGTDGAGEPTTVRMYFFWTETCPHCRRARPFVEALDAELPWLEMRSFLLAEDRPEDIALFLHLSERLGEQAAGVPAFLFCDQMIIGFDTAETTGSRLREALSACHASLVTTGSGSRAASPSAAVAPVLLPVFGEIDPRTASLPLFTVMIAAVDSFNPCAFFVLMFLMSLLAHARQRWRMALIGGIFVLASGLLYFAFMAAWLNVYQLIGEARWLTMAAAVIALALAAINIKDYFWFRRGLSLGIPEKAKPGLFARMRTLTVAENWPVMVIGAVTLAVAANSYELLCTAGFPMVFTRVLTLHDLSPSGYYLYLALYNAVYVVPLLAIAAASVFTFGSRKLQEREGRLLKLLSGLMMLGLGLALLLEPAWLSDARSAGAIILAALAGTALVATWGRRSASSRT